MEFGILGPLEVVADGRPLALGGVKQRTILAVLLLQAGCVVSSARLIEEVWHGRPPDSAIASLHSYVSHLRRILEPSRPRGATFQVLVSRTPGYLLRVEPVQVDATRFEGLLQEGLAALEVGDPDLAVTRLRASLSLWRGPVLAEFPDAVFARSEIARLEELRLVAVETRITADLALGRHVKLVGELEALVEEHPLRERLRGQLMVALYRSGRQAEALGVYRDARALLTSDLGIDPSAELQRLHEAILGHNPDLDWALPEPDRTQPRARLPATDQMSAPDPLPPPRTVFVGRDVELDQLRRALADACSGRGRLVLVSGEPGIGKTSIAHELADQAQGAGAQVLWGRVWEAVGAPAFWPWVQILRSWMETCELRRLGQVLASDAAVIAQLVPEVAQRLHGLANPPRLKPAKARFHLFDAVTRVLKQVASTHPLVVVLDDLHRADVSSLLLLQFLARELADAHMLVIGTFRDAKADLNEKLVGVLAELGRQPVTRRMRLEGLGAEHVGRFVEHATGLQVSPILVAKLHERTDGNPLFLKHLVQPLVKQSDLLRFEEELNECVPEQVQEAVRWRLEQLPKQVRTVLTVASVIGWEFDLNVLGTVTGFEVGVLSELVEQAVAAGFVAEVPRAAGQYRFSHLLVRDALYRQLGARRAGLHRRVGDALEERYANDPGPHLAELAAHFVQATDAAKALAYLTRAGERALTLFAYEEAVRLFTLALDQHPDEARRCDLLFALADSQMRAGELASARSTYLRAADDARTLGAPEQLARAALGCGEIFLAYNLIITGPITRVVGLMEEALAALDAGDSPLRARLLGHLAMMMAMYYWQPNAERRRDSQERRLALSQQAVAMARRLGDPKVLASVLDPTCLALLSPDTLHERQDLAAELFRLAEVAGDKEMAQAARKWRILSLLQLGDIPAVDAQLDTYSRVAEELHQPAHLYWAHIWKGTRALMAGRFDMAEQHNLHALGLGQRLQQLQGQDAAKLQVGVGAQLFLLRREQGRLAELKDAVTGFVRGFPQLPAWLAILALVHAATGEKDAARWDFEELAAKDFTLMPRDSVWMVTLALSAEVCVFLGDVQRATTLYDLLVPYERHCVVVGRGFGCLGSVARFLGQLAVTLGKVEAACRHFEVALEVNERIGAAPSLVHTQAGYARALLARGLPGDREAADALQGQALQTARALGMAPLVQQLCPRPSAGAPSTPPAAGGPSAPPSPTTRSP